MSDIRDFFDCNEVTFGKDYYAGRSWHTDNKITYKGQEFRTSRWFGQAYISIDDRTPGYIGSIEVSIWEPDHYDSTVCKVYNVFEYDKITARNLDNLLDQFHEKIRGREFTTNTYACLVVDEAEELIDRLLQRQFTVPYYWAEDWVRQYFNRSLEDFASSYSWEDTIDMYGDAMEQGVVIESHIELRPEVYIKD